MNVFFVATLGGLQFAHMVVKQENLSNNHLVILGEGTQGGLAEKIVSQADKGCFNVVSQIELPNDTWQFKRATCHAIYNQFDKLITNLKPQTIFINSYNWYYNYIYNLATEKNAKICLFEEGLSTYRLLVGKYAASEVTLVERWAAFRKKRTPKTFAGIFLSYELRQKLKFLAYPRHLQSIFEHVLSFDTVYSVFPEKLKTVFFANRYVKLQFMLPNTPSLADLQMDTDVVLYLDQGFELTPDKHVQIVKNYFADRAERVLVKLHPKATQELRQMFLTHRFKILPIDVPAETVLSSYGLTTLVGITSSTLIYAIEINPTLRLESMALYYEQQAEEIGQAQVHNIRFHRKHLELFSFVDMN